jgi:hypothetical protein
MINLHNEHLLYVKVNIPKGLMRYKLYFRNTFVCWAVFKKCSLSVRNTFVALCSALTWFLPSQFGHLKLSCYPFHVLLKFVVLSTGTLTGMYIFSVWLRIPDSVFALCVFLTKCAQTLIYGFAPKDWYLYIGRYNFITVLDFRFSQEWLWSGLSSGI